MDGRNPLFKSTNNPLKSHLDDIAEVSSRFKRLQQFANLSGTAVAGASPFSAAGGVEGIVAWRCGKHSVKTGTGRICSEMAQAKYALRKPVACADGGLAYGITQTDFDARDKVQGITFPDFMRGRWCPRAGAIDEQCQPVGGKVTNIVHTSRELSNPPLWRVF